MRQGNYICKASLTDEQAIAKLHDDFKEYEENEKIRYSVFHLRSQIMKMPKTKTPDPTTVQVQLLWYLRSGFFEILHCAGVRGLRLWHLDDLRAKMEDRVSNLFILLVFFEVIMQLCYCLFICE
ncbi:hypothetical protein Pcinc_011909 [Petrolisthes cinctipes]|uniref:Uncharacterized protein n=1 Tax=Petrolisthes cinctipes TaxID=88211 RepID=A0AAE1G046_PETCI|nr:hypothetical protein Pcinc_011909 [Petrolisthes cinctipes]